MGHKLSPLYLTIFLAFIGLCSPKQGVAANALQSPNTFNPNIGVTGWIQGEAGHRHNDEESSQAFELKETEIAIQTVVDPYSRADIFLTVEGEESAALEEATLTWFRLPGQLAFKMGKIKAGFGTFNRIHRPETAFGDRPLAHASFLGEEGLAGVGGSLSWHVPNPWIFLGWDMEILTSPSADEVPAFDTAQKKDLLYIGRLSGYYDFSESFNILMGSNLSQGPAGKFFDTATGSSSTLKSVLYGVDLTFRSKDPRRAIDQSWFWQTEIFWNAQEIQPNETRTSLGVFSHGEVQWARRWRTGIRYDWSESPGNNTVHEQGGLLYLTFLPSEFSSLSLQGKQVKFPDGSKETLGFLKILFRMGSHGPHAF